MGAVLADRTRSGRHPKRVGWRLWHECGVACHLERGLVLTEICGQPVFICMRTTLDLNDTLVRRAKALAAERGTSLTQLIEEALREKLVRPTRRTRVKLPTFRGRGGLRPGVSLESTAALLDLLDGDAPR